MNPINASPQMTLASFSTVAVSTSDNFGKISAMRPANDVVKLGGASTPMTGAAPELRAPQAAQDIEERDDAGKLMGVSTLIAMLIGMLNQLMLQDSQRVGASSGREVKLAESGANAQRSAGKAELSGGLAQASIMMAGTAFGTYRSLKGSNMQIKSAKVNVPRSAEAGSLAKGGVSPGVKNRLEVLSAHQQQAHAGMSVKAGKMQTQGNAFQSGSTALSKAAEASQAAAVSAHRADQTIAGSDAGIAGRTTDIELKARAMNDELVSQMRALRDRDIQSKNDAASHVAQGTR